MCGQAKTRLLSVERITVNGMNGATGAVQIRRRDGVFDLRFVAVQQHSRQFSPPVFYSPEADKTARNGSSEDDFSLHTISAWEAAATEPWRLKIRPVQAGDTVARLSRQMAVNNFKEETFRVLNGLRPGDRLRAGQLVKVVAD